MLVTDRGQLIRIPVAGISIVGRSTQGVKVFDTAEDERVVSVEHIPDEGGEDEEGEGAGDGDVQDADVEDIDVQDGDQDDSDQDDEGTPEQA
jgi:DNA gyrase subunit A